MSRHPGAPGAGPSGASKHDATSITVRAENDGIVIRVDGSVDDASGRALLDAVRVAVNAGDAVAIELRSMNGFTSSAVRDLAVCSRLGAELSFLAHRFSSA